jgi:secreted PhoX family phosphatase
MVCAATAAVSSRVLAATWGSFTPMPGSAGPIPIGSPLEATPIALSNPAWTQQTIADRTTQNTQVPGSNSGSWDMIVANETGPNAGRFLFSPFETGNSGVQRIDLQDPNYNTRTVTIVAPAAQGFVSGDMSKWAPWGGYLTAEESWGAGSTKGRIFEVTNATTAGPNGGNFVARNVIPRVSHEGANFDAARSLYFVDELNGGAIFKFVSANPNATSGNDYFAAGQSFALKVGAGGQFEGNNGPAIAGVGTWVPITNATGGPLAGSSVIATGAGTTLPADTIDGRASAALVGASGYNRPEDTEIQVANGVERLYWTTTDSDIDNNGNTGTSRLYNLNVATGEVKLFVDPSTIDLATGAPVGGALRNADNLAIDADGNIYICEDRNGGQDDDLWFCKDLNLDGDLLDVGEGIARWGSNGTQGSEFTGFYFDKFNPNVAYVNIQHPASGNDRTIMVTVPEPSCALVLAGMLGIAVRQRRG